ncbi:MAG: HAMP domain-containing protein [Hyphomicrobiaceae bacterium]|nr:HAMP domain-containing protein [Hyphomicrobiaceae bacterium]
MSAQSPHTVDGRPRWRRILSSFGRHVSGLSRAVYRMMPQGLYARSLMIIIMPVVVLQSVIAFVFMERHWETVTRRLSQSVTQDIAAIISVIETYPHDADFSEIVRIAREDLDLNITVLPLEPLPAALPKPFFSLLDRTLSSEITANIARPFWIDTVGRSNLVEIRILLDEHVLRVYARRSQAYASNSHIFLVWMTGTSIVLLVVAVLFLRNQIRPILKLANAAENFGKGLPAPEDFRIRGAREVRRASVAFLKMRERIERHVEQRTAMLSGVSHDLRTILTRFRLELALLDGVEGIEELRQDVDEMQAMLEAYLAFARGDEGEQPSEVDMAALLDAIGADSQRAGHTVLVRHEGPMNLTVKPQAMKRCLVNLVLNACRYAETVRVSAERNGAFLDIFIDDDGPGIPQDQREDVFRPFVRLDPARNQDASGTGLGLSIARDIARSHGGEITLADSPLGGLRAHLHLPA